jgi:hypothetical protein
MVIPTGRPICRDAGMNDSHPYIALLCFQQDENANPILMFLHLFRIDLVIFLLCFCYLYCSKMIVHPLSVICKHEIQIFLLVGICL